MTLLWSNSPPSCALISSQAHCSQVVAAVGLWDQGVILARCFLWCLFHTPACGNQKVSQSVASTRAPPATRFWAGCNNTGNSSRAPTWSRCKGMVASFSLAALWHEAPLSAHFAWVHEALLGFAFAFARLLEPFPVPNLSSFAKPGHIRLVKEMDSSFLGLKGLCLESRGDAQTFRDLCHSGRRLVPSLQCSCRELLLHSGRENLHRGTPQ